jgi:hypothetical protein
MDSTYIQFTKKYMLYFLSIFPAFDAISGMTLQGKISYGQSVLPVSSSLRLLFILIVLSYIASINIFENPGVILELILIFTGVLVLLVQKVYLNYELADLFTEINIYGKYIFWFTVFIFFYIFRESITREEMSRVILIINITFLVGLLVPYALGVGTATYDGISGFKGWYYGPNDSSYTLITLAFLNLFNHRNGIGFLLQVFNIYGMLLLGTKTAMIASVTMLLVLLIMMLDSKEWYLKVIGSNALVVAVMVGVYFHQKIYESFIFPMVNRLTFFYVKYNGDLTRLIFSGRGTVLKNDISILNNLPNNALGVLFGYGYNYRINFFPIHGGLIEFDMFDVFFSYGIISLVLLVVLITFVVLMANNRRNVYWWLFIFSIIYANIAGHVLFSAMSGTILGIICGALIITCSQEPKNTKIEV